MKQDYNLQVKNVLFGVKGIEVVNLLPSRLNQGVLIPLELLESIQNLNISADNYIRNLSIQIGNSVDIQQAKAIMLQALDHLEFRENFNMFQELNYNVDFKATATDEEYEAYEENPDDY